NLSLGCLRVRAPPSSRTPIRSLCGLTLNAFFWNADWLAAVNSSHSARAARADTAGAKQSESIRSERSHQKRRCRQEKNDWTYRGEVHRLLSARALPNLQSSREDRSICFRESEQRQCRRKSPTKPGSQVVMEQSLGCYHRASRWHVPVGLACRQFRP